MRLARLGCGALALLASACTAIQPQADCSGLAGRYASLSKAESEPLLKYLLGEEIRGNDPVVLTLDGADASLRQGSRRVDFKSPEHFSCDARGEMRLTRQEKAHVRLPPLFDQTVTRTFVFRSTASGNLQLDVHSRTSASPYGIELNGPDQLEKSLVWTRL